MTHFNENIGKLLLRLSELPDGMNFGDYQDFRKLIARRFDPKICAGLEKNVTFREFCHSIRPLLFDTPAPMRGDINIGRNRGGPSLWDSNEACSHLLGVGASGAGKSVWQTSVCQELMELPNLDAIVFFDFFKRELRGNLRLSQLNGYECHICRPEWLSLNPLDPEGIEPSLSANLTSEFLTLSLGLPPVAKHIFKINIVQLYQQCGLFNSPNAKPPKLTELIGQVQNFEGNKSARDAVAIRLQSLLANTGNIFNVRKGVQIKDLTKKKRIVVVELDGWEAQFQDLIALHFVGKLFAYRTAHPSDGLVIVVLDDANRVYSKRAEQANQGIPYIDTMTSVIRQKKIGIFAFVQTTHDLSNSILANSSTKVLFRAGTDDDYEVMGKAMALTKSQRDWAKMNLRPGIQIIKKSTTDWQRPFINFSTEIKIPQDVTDAEAYQSMQSLLHETERDDTPSLPLTISLDQKANIQDPQKLPSDDDILFSQIKANPEVASAIKHYQMAKLGIKRGIAAKESLIKRNLIKETPIEPGPGRRGGAQLFLDVIDDNSGGSGGKGLHRYMRNKADPWYIWQNCTTEAEKCFTIDGQRFYVDLAITWPDGKTEALEVETQDSPRAANNVKKNFAFGFDVVSVLTPNRKVRDAVRNRVLTEIEAKYHERIRFPSISFYE